jgi:hypothetical protein
MPSRGESGYVNAQITVTTGGVYVGGGIAGYTGGTETMFNVKMRRPGLQRRRIQTTDGALDTATGAPVSLRCDLEGYFRQDKSSQVPINYPPQLSQNEFVKLSVTAGYQFIGVIVVERWEFTGDVDGAVAFVIAGETDDIFTFN